MSFIGLFIGIVSFELSANFNNYNNKDLRDDNAMESDKFKSIPNKICRWIMFISTILTLISQCIKLIK